MSGSDEQTEISVAEAYCVVYVLSNKEWQVRGEGWARVHLYRDPQDNTHRIVGWTVQDSEVVINSNVTASCKYKKKSADFHKFVDEEDRTFGFGFYKKDDSFADSDKFMEVIEDVITKELAKESANTQYSEMQFSEKQSVTTPTSTPVIDNKSTSKLDVQKARLDVQQKARRHLGKLQIFSAKPGRHNRQLQGSMTGKKSKKEMTISDPFSIDHKDHVEFDEKTQTFVGLPDEWEASLNKQFGMPLKDCKNVKLDDYDAPIPEVLVTMKDYFLKNNGLSTEGIFRIAPDGAESSYVKDLLNKGKFKSCSDIHCIANLIKVFFRELPGSVIKDVKPERIIECETPEKAGEIIESLREPCLSVVRWLLDLCLMVSAKSKVNKMSMKNLSIVIAPNLFEGMEMAVTLQLVFASKAAEFLGLALEQRQSFTESLDK